MIHFNQFKNYEEFKLLFGNKETGHGRYKILLSVYKDRALMRRHYLATLPVEGKSTAERRAIHEAKAHDFAGCFSIGALRAEVMDALRSRVDGAYYVKIMDKWYYSDKYETDSYGGLCMDGDTRCIRYINKDTDKVYKMKASKMFAHLLSFHPQTKDLPVQVRNWITGELTEAWKTYAQGRVGGHYTLRVDDDFRHIYNDDDGTFGSCMANRSNYHFYENAVSAKAASIEDADGNMLARCVIYTEARCMQDDSEWRLAERQYAKNGDNILKRILVDKLIQEGHIDGYKDVGVGCGDADAFVANDGTSLSDKVFQIPCSLDRGDYLSYQDSFKWYDSKCEFAYNDSGYDHTDELNTTDLYFEGGEEEWSEYEQEFLDPENDDVVWAEDRECYVYRDHATYCSNSNGYITDENVIRLANGDYAYREAGDLIYCEACGEYFLVDDCCYSELLDMDFCSEECKDAAEERYKEENWTYAEVDNEYFEDESDVMVCQQWDGWDKVYHDSTISWDFLKRCLRDGGAVCVNDVYYYGGLVRTEDGELIPNLPQDDDNEVATV